MTVPKGLSGNDAFSALLASGFRRRRDNNQTMATLLPCPLGTFSNSSAKGTDGCTECPPGMLYPSMHCVLSRITHERIRIILRGQIENRLLKNRLGALWAANDPQPAGYAL